MSLDGHWGDEALIDGVLRQLAPERRRLLEDHLKVCNNCLSRYEMWQSLIDTPSEMTFEREALKQRLLRRVNQTGKEKGAPSKRVKRAIFGFGLAFVAVLAVVVLKIHPLSVKHDYSAVQHDSTEQTAFVNDPRTVQYDITPVVAANIRGGVWVNDATKEMLIRIEGLPPIVHKDYQIWFVDHDNRLFGQVLDLQNKKVVLYLSGDTVKRIRYVRTSLEPKGGSPVPTGADTFIVDLKRSSQLNE